MSGTADRGRSARRAAISLVLAAAAYEALARSGVFPAALLPTLPAVARALAEGVLDGSLPAHAASTLYRVLIGMGLAVLIGVPLGILMGRFRSVEGFFLPLASALMPIPSLAWVPVFILWFGLGNATAIGIVFYAALFPLLLNAWTGVRAVNPLWLRAGSALGADERALFWKVIVPGASPFLITGLRQAFLRAWIAVVGAEMLAASDWGLGWVIFDAKEFLRADVMLASLAVIGLIGFLVERLVFGSWSAPRCRGGVWCGGPRAEQTMPHISVRDVSLVYDTPAGRVTGVRAGELRHRASRVPLPGRAQRLREVDAAQHHRRVPRAHRRRGADRRQADRRARHGPRHRVPGFRPAVSLAHGARQRRLRPGDEGHAARPSARGSRSSSCASSSSRSSRRPIRTTSPAACSSASPSPGRWPTIRACC